MNEECDANSQVNTEKRKKIDISLIFFAVAGVIICREALPLGLGSLHDPQSGLFPFITGAVLAGLAASLMVLNCSRPGKATWLAVLITWKRVLPVVIALLVYVFLFDLVGFLTATFLFVAFLIKGVESKPWPLVVAAALAVAVFVDLVFRVWLGVQLPTGFWGI